MNLILTLFSFIVLGLPSDDHFGSCCPVTLSTTDFDVSHETDAFKSFFNPIAYDEESEMLIIEGKQNIQYVDIFESEDVSWTLYVDSDKLYLSKSFFKNHDTKLSFYLKDVSSPYDIFLDFKK